MLCFKNINDSSSIVICLRISLSIVKQGRDTWISHIGINKISIDVYTIQSRLESNVKPLYLENISKLFPKTFYSDK